MRAPVNESYSFRSISISLERERERDRERDMLLLTLLNHKTVVLASTVSHIAEFNLRLSLDKYISRHTDVFFFFVLLFSL